MEKKNINNDFEKFIKKQPVQEDEKKAIHELFRELDEIDVPQPSESMEKNFYKRLEDYKLKQTSTPGFKIHWPNSEKLFGLSAIAFKPAFAAIIFLLGVIGGVLLDNHGTEDKQLVSELQNTREMLMLTLLEQPSATDRLKAVNLTDELTNPDQMVIQSLLATLNKDENVNVRLAAIEALFRYSNMAEVRKGLIEAIPNQESPLVLITLSKAMVLLQEKASVEKLRQAINNDKLEEKAKEKINENIQKII